VVGVVAHKQLAVEKLNLKVRVPKSGQVRIHSWRKMGISLTAVSSKGNLVNFVCGGVTMGQPTAARNACKAEATRQKEQRNYLGWRGSRGRKDWGKGEGGEKAIQLQVLTLQTWRSVKANIAVTRHPYGAN